jgi:hypothetical protein
MWLCATHTDYTCHYNEVCNAISIDDQGEVLICSSNGSIFTCVIDMRQKVGCAKPKFQEWHALTTRRCGQVHLVFH